MVVEGHENGRWKQRTVDASRLKPCELSFKEDTETYQHSALPQSVPSRKQRVKVMDETAEVAVEEEKSEVEQLREVIVGRWTARGSG